MISVTDVLKRLGAWMHQQSPFFHTRYGDGELMCMFQMHTPEEKNCDGHNFFPTLSMALRLTFLQIAHSGIENLIIGSNNQTHPNEPWTIEFKKFLQANYVDRELPWAVGDFWWSPYENVEGKEEIIQLIDMIREQQRAILVCKSKVADARYCLGSRHVEIPETNAWEKRGEIFEDCCSKYLARGVYLWAAGMPGKVLAWNVKQKFPKSSHIDIGHLFDGVFGLATRGWHLPKEQVGRHHREFCEQVFNPYVQGFIP